MRKVVGVLIAIGVVGSLTAPAVVKAVVLDGAQAGDKYGWAVAHAGDVNKDGLSDFLVGIPNRNSNGENAGEVHLYLGRVGVLPTKPDLVIKGETGGDEFGYAVSTAGDVNGDGYDDWLVGAPGRDSNGLDAGTVYLFLGSSNPNKNDDQVFDGDLPGGRFGASVAGGFDFNGDRRDDFAAGAPDHNGAGLRAGQVRIFTSGGESYADEAYAIEGDFPNWALGFSLDSAGDVNGDGRDDVIAGAPQPHDLNSGRAVIWYGTSFSLGEPSRTLLSGEVGTDRFGWDVSGAGDINGDRKADVLVGAPENGFKNGAIYLFHGGSNMNTNYDWRVKGDKGGDLLGYSVDGGFDWDGDEWADVIAGAPGTDDVASGAGRVYVYSGKNNLPNIPDLVRDPEPPVASFEADDAFGSSIRFVGSYNGDGFAEVLVGAPNGNTDGGAEAGYVNFMSFEDSFVPVSLIMFQATSVVGTTQLAWEVADATSVLGFRLEGWDGTQYQSLHEGWLNAQVRDWSHDKQNYRSYRLYALERNSGVRLMAETKGAGGSSVQLLGANPFQDRILFQVFSGPSKVDVLDAQGRRVRQVGLDGVGAGQWDGRDERGVRVPAGVYFLRFQEGSRFESVKVHRLP
ncbi:MAG: hypothetical protein HKN21_09885 [Candidatus Eisenbacteria bacterium]|uniref:T9SS type A sorting domain-containing protein n=1 Tax=Eiseniibacteriota bacterium TaxID=2212470 RepID=A0A7Y2EC11_UNCEI|nr:hypothetical protein [Candidatus Eisenbacteria bacterium]